jgi:hypothetical protein
MDFPRDLSGNIFPGRSAVARSPMRITVGTTLYNWSIYLLQRSTVRTVLFPGKHRFQQDNDPKHRSKIANEFMTKKQH